MVFTGIIFSCALAVHKGHVEYMWSSEDLSHLSVVFVNHPGKLLRQLSILYNKMYALVSINRQIPLKILRHVFFFKRISKGNCWRNRKPSTGF